MFLSLLLLTTTTIIHHHRHVTHNTSHTIPSVSHIKKSSLRLIDGFQPNTTATTTTTAAAASSVESPQMTNPVRGNPKHSQPANLSPSLVHYGTVR